MITDLPNTTSQDVAKRLVRLRHDLGAVTLGRVLTLVVPVSEQDADQAIEAANDATRQAPSRIIVLVESNRRGGDRMDAQIRLGGDAGASEIVVLRLYGGLFDHGRSVITPMLLPDSRIVTWWPGTAPDDVASSPLGSMAARRITDAATARSPRKQLERRAKSYAEGDTDLAWTRLTRWRGLLAAALDQPPYEPVTEATVTGALDSPSSDLLAAWLAERLGCTVRRARTRAGSGLVSVRLERRSGPIDLVRTEPTIATLSQPDQPVRRLSLVEAGLGAALAEELRRLDADEVYAAALRSGLAKVGTRTITAAAAVRAEDAPDVDEARRAGERSRRAVSGMSASSMVDHEEPPADGGPAPLEEVTAARLDVKQQREPGTRGPAADERPSAALPPAAQAAGADGGGKPATKKADAKKGTAKKATRKASSSSKAASSKGTGANPERTAAEDAGTSGKKSAGRKGSA